MTLSVDLPNVYLKPGELIFSTCPTFVTTVLGSCISLTMINHKFKIGAIIHAMLPAYKENNSKDPFNYVDRSINYVLEQYGKKGINPGNIEAKLFGGANMFSDNILKSETVGSQNIRAAQNLIEQYGIRLVKSDVGGIVSRKIIFNTSTGDVWLKRINKNNALGQFIGTEAE